MSTVTHWERELKYPNDFWIFHPIKGPHSSQVSILVLLNKFYFCVWRISYSLNIGWPEPEIFSMFAEDHEPILEMENFPEFNAK